MRIIEDVPVFGEPDPGAMRQMKTCALTADKVALMGDHHQGYSVPIGGVVAYRDAISPSGVGFDIACGNKAILTDADPTDVVRNIKQIMDDVWKIIPFGVGSTNQEEVEHPLFDDPLWSEEPMKRLRDKARRQLGSVGSGNHYVDVFLDERDPPRVWVGCHFGSRGFGHGVATYFLELGGAQDGLFVEPCVFKCDSGIGGDYLRAMRLAGEYAYAGRDWVCDRVSRILGCQILDSVHNHHNFAWREEHWDEPFWVVRKGATPAFPGQRGFVGGSMGEISVILEGVAPPDEETRTVQKLAMFSTVHGAGRVLGRAMAKGKFDKRAGAWKRAPMVTRESMLEWIGKTGVELRGAGVDESPHCYKRLPEVLREHAGTVKVLETLRPIGVAMADDGKSED